MITAGIDVGSSAAKAVLLQDDVIVASTIIPTGLDSAETGELVFSDVIKKAGIDRGEVSAIVATGYGRVNVPFADKHITEISCHARGIHSVLPKVRTVLDMGGQDIKVIILDNRGNVENFIMNDKCAAGTGRYLERVAVFTEVPLEEIGAFSVRGEEQAVHVSNFCTVFAQQDVISLMREGVAVERILAGVCDGLVERILPLILRMDPRPDFAVTGGIAKNIGVVKRLEKALNMPAFLANDPQLMGALGAAYFAKDCVKNER